MPSLGFTECKFGTKQSFHLYVFICYMAKAAALRVPTLCHFDTEGSNQSRQVTKVCETWKGANNWCPMALMENNFMVSHKNMKKMNV